MPTKVESYIDQYGRTAYRYVDSISGQPIGTNTLGAPVGQQIAQGVVPLPTGNLANTNPALSATLQQPPTTQGQGMASPTTQAATAPPATKPGVTGSTVVANNAYTPKNVTTPDPNNPLTFVPTPTQQTSGSTSGGGSAAIPAIAGTVATGIGAGLLTDGGKALIQKALGTGPKDVLPSTGLRTGTTAQPQPTAQPNAPGSDTPQQTGPRNVNSNGINLATGASAGVTGAVMKGAANAVPRGIVSVQDALPGGGFVDAAGGDAGVTGGIGSGSGMDSIGNFISDPAGSLSNTVENFIADPISSLEGIGLNMGAGIAGGLVGGAIGKAIGSNQSGGSYGSTIGGFIGSAWGPIGTFIGSTLGRIIGGFIGAHPTTGPVFNVAISNDPNQAQKGQAYGNDVGYNQVGIIDNREDPGIRKGGDPSVSDKLLGSGKDVGTTTSQLVNAVLNRYGGQLTVNNDLNIMSRQGKFAVWNSGYSKTYDTLDQAINGAAGYMLEHGGLSGVDDTTKAQIDGAIKNNDIGSLFPDIRQGVAAVKQVADQQQVDPDQAVQVLQKKMASGGFMQ